MSIAHSTSSHNMIMAATFKPLTNLVDLRTFDNFVETDVDPSKKNPYPLLKNYHWKIQLLTWITHPIDDLIRAFSVPYFAAAGHFCKIYDCFQKGKKIEGTFRIITTPIWCPFKLVLKTAIFVPFLAIQCPISIIFPYRTLITCSLPLFVNAKETTTRLGLSALRLSISKDFEENCFYPLKTKKGFTKFDIRTDRGEQIFGVAAALLLL